MSGNVRGKLAHDAPQLAPICQFLLDDAMAGADALFRLHEYRRPAGGNLVDDPGNAALVVGLDRNHGAPATLGGTIAVDHGTKLGRREVAARGALHVTRQPPDAPPDGCQRGQLALPDGAVGVHHAEDRDRQLLDLAGRVEQRCDARDGRAVALPGARPQGAAQPACRAQETAQPRGRVRLQHGAFLGQQQHRVGNFRQIDIGRHTVGVEQRPHRADVGEQFPVHRAVADERFLQDTAGTRRRQAVFRDLGTDTVELQNGDGVRIHGQRRAATASLSSASTRR